MEPSPDKPGGSAKFDDCNGYNESSCDQNNFDQSIGDELGLSSEMERTLGATFKNDFKQWGADANFEPIPIKRTLESISVLLKEEFLTKNSNFGMDHTLNATGIKIVFNRVLEDYCHLVAGLNKTVCDQKFSGCGLNSNCPLTYAVNGSECLCNAPDNCKKVELAEVPSVCINDPKSSTAPTTLAPATTAAAAATTIPPEYTDGYRCCHEAVSHYKMEPGKFYNVDQSAHLCDKSAVATTPAPQNVCPTTTKATTTTTPGIYESTIIDVLNNTGAFKTFIGLIVATCKPDDCKLQGLDWPGPGSGMWFTCFAPSDE